MRRAYLLITVLLLPFAAAQDLNADGRVDLQDLLLVTGSYGRTAGYDARADTNSDGRVDLFDLVRVARRFGTVSSGTSWFTDDFESGDLSKTGNGFSWGAGSRVVAGTSRSGSHSMRFSYGPDAPGEDSTAEQGFVLAPDGTVAPSEIWIEYYLRVPDTFVVRDDWPANNKLLAVWAEAYSSVGDVQTVFEFERTNDTSNHVRVLCMSGSGCLGGVVHAELFEVSMRGQWVRMRHHLKAGDGNGSVEVWRDDTLVYEIHNYTMWFPGGNNYFRNGYLLGWANSGYTEQTDFYVDDFTVWTQDPGWEEAAAVVFNEPAGFTAIDDESFPARDAGAWSAYGGASLLSVNDLSDAPVSPSDGVRFSFASQAVPGDATVSAGSIERILSEMGMKDSLYSRYTFRVSEAYKTHPTRMQKMAFIYYAGNYRLLPMLAGEVADSTTASLRPYMTMDYNGGVQIPNNVNDVEILRGRWYTYETLLAPGTAGNADGSLTWWITDHATGETFLAGNHTGLSLVPPTESPSISVYKFDPAWGGLGGTIDAPWDIDIDHIYISAKEPVAPYYAEDFEDGKTDAGGFSWAVGVPVSGAQAYSGTQSLLFSYGPDAPGEDSSAEQRFVLAPDAASAPTEVWIEYMLRVPDNFAHRDELPGNNKFLTLWAEDYSMAEQAQFYASLEHAPGDASDLYFISIHGDDPRYPSGYTDPQGVWQTQWNAPGNGGSLLSAADQGRWVRIRLHARLGVDGELQLWKDDALISSITDWNMVRAAQDWDYYRHGYLMGWSNSGYTERTDFYLDDFRVYTEDPGWA